MMRDVDVEGWLAYAEADLRAAEHLFESEDFMACAFHCQQAIEKLLKAIIVSETGERPPYLHNLRLLVEQVSTISIPDNIVDKLISIEPHYIGTRYPGVVDREVYDRETGQQVLSDTREVYKWFRSKLDEMSRSNDS